MVLEKEKMDKNVKKIFKKFILTYIQNTNILELLLFF